LKKLFWIPIILLLIMGNAFPVQGGFDSGPAIVAHRGASSLAPENTLAAVAMALQQGAPIIEIDVHQTRDGELVVIHDFSLDRTTTGEGSVYRQFFPALQELSAGSWFGEHFLEQRVPSLREVLELVDGQAKLMIHVKGNQIVYPGIHRNIYNLVMEYEARDWVIIKAVSYSLLRAFYRLDPHLNLHQILALRALTLPLYLNHNLGIFRIRTLDFVQGVSINHRFASPRVIEYFLSLGLDTNVWTVNCPERARYFAELGVTGIITDYPDLLLIQLAQ